MAGGSFSSLKSSLSSRLRSPPTQAAAESNPAEPAAVETATIAPKQYQHDSQTEQSGNSTSYQPYQPFLKVSSSNADPGLFSELQNELQSAIRKKSSRKAPRERAAADVYQPSDTVMASPSGRPRDEKFEAVIQELRAVWSIKIPQMLQDVQKKRKEAKRPELEHASTSQHLSDTAMHSRYQADSGSSAQDSPARSNRIHKHLFFTTPPPANTESVNHARDTGNERPESEPITQMSSVTGEVSESANKPKPYSTMSSLLADLAKTRSGILESEGERSQEGEPEYRAEFTFGRRKKEYSREDGSSTPHRYLIRRPMLKDENAHPHSNISNRAMSSMAQKATELLDDLNTGKDTIPPWGIDISKADPKVDNEVHPSANASQILETLHPKAKETKASRTVKKEGKAEKVSGKKAKRSKNDDKSKKGAEIQTAKSRRTRSRAAAKIKMVPSLRVRKLLVPEDPRGKTAKAGLQLTELKVRTRRRSPVRKMAPPPAVRKHYSGPDVETSSSVELKGGEEGKTNAQPHPLQPALSAVDPSDVVSIDPAKLEIKPLDISQPPVPGIQHGLDRVLFNPGVFQLQDPHSRVYNFDPYLQKIMPVVEFDYNALKQYKTSSQDTALSDLAKEHNKRYIGSTSSMTGTLGHFHYLISNFRPLNLKMLSRSFPDSLESFTQINRAPNAIFLRNKGDGIYAIDADKEFDGPNVLMMLGKSMEKLLTLPKADYERYRKEHSHLVTEEERTAPEAYEYTTMGDFLMRSQLDAHDSRLPGTGMFDLKTRAVVSVRMNSSDYEPMTGYEIQTLQGRFQSYEREYYDMMRSTMLKYMLQVRMGRMDGIFLAYHNVERIFGFQYVPLHEMDRAIHGQADLCLGDQEFKLSLDLLNKVLDKATAKFPDSSLRLHFETTEEKIGDGSPTTMMWVYAVPMSEDEINDIQSGSYERTAEFERTMMGIDQDKSVDVVNRAAAEDGASERKDTSPERSQVELAILPDSDTASTTIKEPTSDSETTTNADAAPGSEDAEYLSTTTDAAPTFTGILETHVEPELQPLFAASIVCKSRTNGTAHPRPEKLKPDDKWELEYLFQEWNASGMIWARYEDLKSRRKAIFDKLRKEDETENGGDEEGVDKKKKTYIDFLKSMSQRGRAFRERIDELEAGKEPVVVGQPFGRVEESAEKIETLDDYFGWLYRADAHKAQET